MKTMTITITDEESEILSMINVKDRNKYVEDNLVPQWVACGYGYYGVNSLDGTRLEIKIGDSCD